MNRCGLGLMVVVLGAGCFCSVGAEKAAKDGDAAAVSMFGGTPQRNMVNTVEKNVPSDWSIEKGKEKNIKWVAALGNTSYGGPVVAGGKVYVGTNNERPRDPRYVKKDKEGKPVLDSEGKPIPIDKGVVMCFDAATGKFLWQAAHDKLGNNDLDWEHQGIASSPAVEGDRLYYVSNRCELVCAGTADGKSIWRLDMMKELGVSPRFLAMCSPLVVGDLVFAITGNGLGGAGNPPKVVAPKAPSFIAVNKTTGKLAWQDNSPGDKIMEGQWSNPAYGEIKGKPQVIFPGGDGWLYAFEPAKGTLIWKFDCNPKKSEFKLSSGNRNYIMATPVVYDDKIYVGVGRNPEEGAGEGHFWCIDATKVGDISSEVVTDGKVESNKNSGVVWHYGGPAPQGGDRDIVFGRTLSTCAIHDGLLYVAELDGFLHCLDAKTGKKYWEHDLKTPTWASPYWVDGKIYLGDDNGQMNIFAHGKEKKLPGALPKNYTATQLVVSTGPPLTKLLWCADYSWAKLLLVGIKMDKAMKGPTVAVNGVLYFMTASELYAIENK